MPSFGSVNACMRSGQYLQCLTVCTSQCRIQTLIRRVVCLAPPLDEWSSSPEAVKQNCYAICCFFAVLFSLSYTGSLSWDDNFSVLPSLFHLTHFHDNPSFVSGQRCERRYSERLKVFEVNGQGCLELISHVPLTNIEHSLILNYRKKQLFCGTKPVQVLH